MPGGEEHRQDEDRVPGQHEGGGAGGEHEQGHLGRGVEAQPHEEADRVEVPGLADPPGHPAEQAGEEAAVVQVVLELGLVELPRSHPPEDPGDAHGGAEVHQADEQQERAGDEGADQAEGLADLGVLVLDDAGDRPHAGHQQQAGEEDDRGVPEGEPEAGAHRRLALADELAGRVVDRGDVVGVEGVPDAEHVGRQADADTQDAGAAERVLRAGRRRRPARPSRRRAAAARTRSCRRCDRRSRRLKPGRVRRAPREPEPARRVGDRTLHRR